MYYDADLSCYYEYDYENKKYSLHSRVQLPEQEKEKTRKFRRRSSSPEYIGLLVSSKLVSELVVQLLQIHPPTYLVTLNSMPPLLITPVYLSFLLISNSRIQCTLSLTLLYYECLPLFVVAADSPEEGEIRLPHIPRGSPPPEDEWEPCIRAVVSESEKLPRGTLFIITQDGAFIGRCARTYVCMCCGLACMHVYYICCMHVLLVNKHSCKRNNGDTCSSQIYCM